MTATQARTTYRTIWISDTHLGNRNAQAQHLLEFLQQHHCETLFLVGDIIDLWKMSERGHWPKSHQAVVNQILTMADNGVRVVYVPGNHDPFFRKLVGHQLGHVEVHMEYVHQLVDGRRLLVVHGDCFDDDIAHSRFLFWLGDHAYETIVSLNRWLNHWRARFGKPYWSLSGFLKVRSKKAQHFVNQFEQRAIAEAQTRGLDGIVCGHIHQAKLAEVEGVLYINDGDWLESCSSVVETQDGTLQLVHWATAHQQHVTLPPKVAKKPRPAFSS